MCVDAGDDAARIARELADVERRHREALYDKDCERGRFLDDSSFSIDEYLDACRKEVELAKAEKLLRARRDTAVVTAMWPAPTVNAGVVPLDRGPFRRAGLRPVRGGFHGSY